MTCGPTVFVVDDDEAFLESLLLLLRSAGYRCQGYASAAALLTDFRPAAHGCLVCDVRMPEIDGLALQLKLAGESGALPIVFLTGYDDRLTAEHALRQGAVDFLMKSCDEGDLFAAIQRALDLDAANRAKAAGPALI